MSAPTILSEEVSIGKGLAALIWPKVELHEQVATMVLQVKTSGQEFSLRMTPDEAAELGDLLRDVSFEVWIHNQAALPTAEKRRKRRFNALIRATRKPSSAKKAPK